MKAKSLIKWSGREDSNLRPLPPENDDRRHTGANPSLNFGFAPLRSHMFAIRLTSRFKPNLGALFHGRVALMHIDPGDFTPEALKAFAHPAPTGAA